MRELRVLSDGDISLSPLGPEDFEAHLAGEDAELIKWLSGGPATAEGLRDYLGRCEQWWAACGPFHNFGIRVGSVLAGTADVQTDQSYLVAGQENLSYGLYPEHRGRGIAVRAVKLACRYAAGLGLSEAIIRCEPENRRSAGVAERAGFAYLERRTSADKTVLDWYTTDLTRLTRR